MAKIKWGAIVTDGRGKVGGSIFSKNRAGAYQKNWATVTNPNTSYQTSVRNRLKTYSQNWRSLTEAQRFAWNSAVSSFQKTNVFGDIKTPSGFDLYVRLNCNINQVGGSAITLPPKPSTTPAITGLSITADGGLSSISVVFNASLLSSSDKIVLLMTAGLSSGISYVKNLLREVVILPYNQSSPYEAYSVWHTRFGTLTNGQRISIAMQVVNSVTGQKSIRFPATTIVAHTPIYNAVVYYTNVSNGGAFPTGWSTDQPTDWIADNAATYVVNSFGYTGASGSYKFVNVDEGDGVDYLYSPAINLTGASNVRVSFGAICYGFDSPDYMSYSLDGGTTWVDVVDFSVNSVWTLITNTITALANQPSVIFRFQQSGSDGFGINYIGIDDFKVVADYL